MVPKKAVIDQVSLEYTQLCLGMQEHTDVYIYIYTHLYICIYKRIYIYIYLHMYIDMYIHMHMNIFIHISLCVHVYILLRNLGRTFSLEAALCRQPTIMPTDSRSAARFTGLQSWDGDRGVRV